MTNGKETLDKEYPAIVKEEPVNEALRKAIAKLKEESNRKESKGKESKGIERD